MSKIVKRSDKVAFYGVRGTDGETVFHRMKGFTEIAVNKNPKEYTRQYVDEAFERTDVVGYAAALSYGFDQHTDDAVHTDIAAIHTQEKLGAEAVRSVVMVDFTAPVEGENSFAARMRDFSVVPDSEGSSMDAYTYSGSFKTAGKTVAGVATTTDNWQTCTFTEN